MENVKTVRKNGKELRNINPGINIIPCKPITDKARPKAPALKSWRKYESEKTPPELWLSHYINGGLVGLICGKISGNLEVIDIDSKNDATGEMMDKFLASIPKEILNDFIIQETPSGGKHLIYRCETIEGNQVLAKNEAGKPLIETRGEGGYVCHGEEGSGYKLINGELPLMESDIEIPTISQDIRETIFSIARKFDRFVENTHILKVSTKDFKVREEVKLFNEEVDILQLFLDSGWKVGKENPDYVELTRPGKSAGTSAVYNTKNHKVPELQNTIKVYSSSTPFNTDRIYSPFEAFRVLKNLNYKEGLKILREDYGYSSALKEDIYQQIIDFLKDKGIRYDSVSQTLVNDKWEMMGDTEINTLYIEASREIKHKFSLKTFKITTDSQFVESTNRVEKFIDKNKGLPRSPKIFDDWIGCFTLKREDIREEITYFFKKWMVGLVAQVLDGPYPNSFFLTILSSKMGIGKTHILQHNLLPKELKDYISVKPFNGQDKDYRLALTQNILIIDEELEGRSWKENRNFKSLLSMEVLTDRKVWGSRDIRLKRRCSFAGTANNLEIIQEPENRRVIPIEVEAVDWKKANKFPVELLFMEAYYLFKEGFKYSYDVREERGKMKKIYTDYILMDSLDLIIEEYIDKPDGDIEKAWISTNDLRSVLTFHTDIKNIDSRSLTTKMKGWGYKDLRKGK